MSSDREKYSFIRTRVRHAFNQIARFPLTLLSAPVGYGKTSELRAFLSREPGSFVWLTISKRRSNPRSIVNQLVDAVASQYGAELNSFADLAFPLNDANVDRFIEQLRAVDDGAARYVVIEGYDRLRQPQPLARLIRALALAEIDSLHVVVLTQKRIALQAEVLRDRALIQEIGISELAYSVDDIVELLRVEQLPCDREDAETIYAMTQGWPLVVRLLLRDREPHQPYELTREVEFFLRDEVFDQLPKVERDLLIRLSIFERFSLSLVADVFRGCKSLSFLQALLKSSPFIEAEDIGEMYTIHPLFRWYLRRRLADEALDFRDVYVRAGRWFAERGDCDAAAPFFIRGGQIETYLAWANDQPNRVTYESLETVRAIYDAVPKRLYAIYPFALLTVAAHFAVHEVRSVVPFAADIVDTIADIYADRDSANRTYQIVLGVIEILRFWLAYNDLPAMLDHADEAKRRLLPDNTCLFCQKESLIVGMPSILFAFFRAPSSLASLTAFIREKAQGRLCDVCRAANEAVVAAEEALETGRLEEADILARQSFVMAGASHQLLLALSALFIQVRLRLGEGDFAAAEAILKSMRRALADPSWRIGTQNKISFSRVVDLCEGYAFTYMNQRQRQAGWLKVGDEPSLLPFGSTGFANLIRGRALLQGTVDATTESALEAFQVDLMVYRPQLGRLHNLVQLAAVRQALYGTKRGAETLRMALKEAAEDDLVLLFAEYAGHILPMLAELRRSAFEPAAFLVRVERLCRQFEKHYPSPSGSRVITLSRREREVLQLLENGLTRNEIGERLLIAPSTVKRHCENIFRKLGVTKASQAVLFAREHKLL